jgi:hypothetical protein
MHVSSSILCNVFRLNWTGSSVGLYRSTEKYSSAQSIHCLVSDFKFLVQRNFALVLETFDKGTLNYLSMSTSVNTALGM